MRYWVVVLFAFLTTPAWSEAVIVGKEARDTPESYCFTMGDSVQVDVSGECADRVRAELAKNEASRAVTLYLDGVRMTNLPVTPLQLDGGEKLRLAFTLVRDPADDDNRQAWDVLFKKKRRLFNLVKTLQVDLAVGHDLPVAVTSPRPFRFHVAPAHVICLTVGVCCLLFGSGYYWLVRYTSALRDHDTGYYSLGKSQMAFWGLLVAVSFAGVFIVTRSMERIPPPVLILLGISGGAGLASSVINNSKKSEAQARIAQLRKDEDDLKSQLNVGPMVSFRLTAIQGEIGKLSTLLQLGQSKGFWHDICDDGSGLSFHRMQVVIWTIILGAVFVWSVVYTVSMPDFSDTLLALLGVSNATYVGFKIPEKP
jgi:hypothetical protein